VATSRILLVGGFLTVEVPIDPSIASIPTLQRVVTMATQRRFGQETHGNARRGLNTSPAARIEIVTKRGLGVSVSELRAEYGRSKSATHYTLRTNTNASTTREKPRSDRPPMLSLHQKNIIYRKARARPKKYYSELAEVGVIVRPDGTSSKPPSRTTLWRTLKRRASERLASQCR
jgi:transposase